MNAPEQLTFLEPTGAEVVRLAVRALAVSKVLEACATRAEVRGFRYVAATYRAAAELKVREAGELEMLAQLEALAGVHDGSI